MQRARRRGKSRNTGRNQTREILTRKLETLCKVAGLTILGREQEEIPGYIGCDGVISGAIRVM